MIEDFGIGHTRNHKDPCELGFVARLAGLPMEVPNFQTNRHCDASMETIHRIAIAIMVGAIDCGLSLGLERMTQKLFSKKTD
jgi:acetyl-CoA C-acetyltransferase